MILNSKGSSKFFLTDTKAIKYGYCLTQLAQFAFVKLSLQPRKTNPCRNEPVKGWANGPCRQLRMRRYQSLRPNVQWQGFLLRLLVSAGLLSFCICILKTPMIIVLTDYDSYVLRKCNTLRRRLSRGTLTAPANRCRGSYTRRLKRTSICAARNARFDDLLSSFLGRLAMEALLCTSNCSPPSGRLESRSTHCMA